MIQILGVYVTLVLHWVNLQFARISTWVEQVIQHEDKIMVECGTSITDFQDLARQALQKMYVQVKGSNIEAFAAAPFDDSLCWESMIEITQTQDGEVGDEPTSVIFLGGKIIHVAKKKPSLTINIIPRSHACWDYSQALEQAIFVYGEIAMNAVYDPGDCVLMRPSYSKSASCVARSENIEFDNRSEVTI
ncbi:hypothetical protein ABFS83_04G134400 [Erythranthe nasuta]